MVLRASNLSTWEADEEEFQVQGQPVIHKGIHPVSRQQQRLGCCSVLQSAGLVNRNEGPRTTFSVAS